MAPRKAKTKKGKKYNLELSLSSMFFWGLGLFVLLGWIFVLGILVGRGFLPGGVNTLTELKTQVVKLQDMVNRKDSLDVEVLEEPRSDPEFAFYNELSAKKEEAAKKSKISREKHKPPPERKSEKAKRIKSSETGKAYTLQIASLESEIKAIKMVNQLIDQGYHAYYYKASVKGKDYYRVRCGKFRDREDADVFRRQLAGRERIEGFVIGIEE
ncbi:MAG: SPOR domain-containing protein [Thermodesulfobacteriota bacterium]|nr:SPOR domain-containing protein [Thermodesulfobacteriota bacterium]